MRASTVSDLKRQDVLHGRLACAVFLADGRIGASNTAFGKLLGYDAETLATITLTQLTGDEIAAQLRADAPSDDVGAGLDCSFIRQDGTPIWVHAIASIAQASSSDEGNEMLLQLVSIERQKTIEAALALSESRLNFALEAAGQGVWDHDVPSDTMFFSPGWRQMRGIPLDEEVGGSLEAWLERLHPDDRSHIQSAAKFQGEAFRVLEYREQHRDGHYIWVQSRGRPVAWNETGVATRMLGTDTDITERKESDLQFQIMSRRLELALEVSRIGVWEQELDTAHVIWDRRMHEIYGRGQQAEALSERDWELAIHPDDRQRAKHDFSTAVQNRSDYTSEFRIVLPDGNIRHIRSRGRYFAAELGSGKLIGAEWDITHDVERTEQLYDARLLAEARFNELQKAQKRIRHAAMHDHLTDLPNRRFLDQKLAELSPSVNKHGRRLAVLHVDLDWFKQINDHFGHAAGDFMLQHVAGVLRRNAHDDDFIARVGGDEFIILSWFRDTDASLRTVASRIIEALAEAVPYNEVILQIGASIGIAYAGPEPVSAASLLQRADVALYRAKALGRNRYELAELHAA